MSKPEVDEEEVVRYERVRQRLIALIPKHPWIYEICVAVEGRKCNYCSKKTVVENPPNCFRCTACGADWSNQSSRPQVGYASR